MYMNVWPNTPIPAYLLTLLIVSGERRQKDKLRERNVFPKNTLQQYDHAHS